MKHIVRKYGKPPFNVAVIHGGPGASGEMAPVAQELAASFGVLEPFQTKNSIAEQVQELKEIVEQYAEAPITLIGFSWGAWLSWIFAARYPTFVKKLILVGSGPFDEKYVPQMRKTLLNRLSDTEKSDLCALEQAFNNPDVSDKNTLFEKFGKLFAQVDTYEALMPDYQTDTLQPQFDIYNTVWPEAAQLRKSGELLKMGQHITCPVIAIHGDYDRHPAEGVQKPLSGVVKNFEFILLKNCGHKPWIEKSAKSIFYEILTQELQK
jgi:pimeloyl-ACP methyl ester carboxylesterase